MGYLEDRAITSLETQLARAQAKLDEGRPGSPINFLSGLALGTVAGALLTFYFTREEELPEEVAPRDDDPILLRQNTAGTNTTSTAPRPLAAMPGATEQGVTDQLAAAELESPAAVKDIAGAADKGSANVGEDATRSAASTATGGRIEPVDGTCPASHPIKGNKSSMGALIYHTPASASYDRTRPEACFATEADAEAAGYRAPRG